MRNLSDAYPESDRSPANPFIDETFVENATPVPGVAEIHTGAMSQCVRLFENLVRDGERGQHWGNSGRTILIASPRAGYGKTHLVGRLRIVTESLVAAINLPFDPSRSISWPAMLSSILRQYQDARCPQHVGCSLMDETARFFISNIVQAALSEGAIQERDLPETEVALRTQFRDVMAPDSGTKMLQWIRKRLPELSAAVGRPMGQRWKLTQRAIAFWGGVFLDQIEQHNDALEPLRGLPNGEARERLLQYLRISTECRPAAFVADHLDGFFGSDTAGMAMAEVLTSIGGEVPRSISLLCLNEDVWDSVFEKQLPSAWLDRLTGEPATLGGIGLESAVALISTRMQAAGISRETAQQFANYVRVEERWEDPETSSLFPRDIIRCARKKWESVGSRFMQNQNGTKPATEPIPAAAPAPAPVEYTQPIPFPQTAPQQPQAPAQPAPAASFQNPASPLFAPSPGEPAPNPIASQIRQQADEAIRQQQGYQPQQPPVQHPPMQPLPVQQPSPARNLTGIESIIDEIRVAGGRSVSDTGSVSQQQHPQSPPPHHQQQQPPSIPSQFQAGSLNVQSTRPQPEASPANPFTALDPEQRLQDLEMELLTSDIARVQWDLRRVETLIRTVGRYYEAVGQVEEPVPGSRKGCLRWLVKGQTIILGFELPQNAYFWNTLLKRAVASTDPAKLTVLSNIAEPFDSRTLASFGIDQATAMRYIDVVEVSEGDMALLYASERFLEESEAAGKAAAAIRIIARRLDPFWRRLTRSLSVPVAE